MGDLISRQAGIDYFVTNVGFHDEDGYPIEDECELREIWTGYFDGIPSAEPKRIKGRWLSHYDYCKKHEYIPSEVIALWWCDQCEQGVEHPTNFCPNCGANMKG